MTGDTLSDDHHVVRYVSPSKVLDDGTIDGSGFHLRQGETGLSVHWIEAFAQLAKSAQLDEVRRLIRLSMSSNGQLAELNVGATRRHLSRELHPLNFVHRPLTAEAQYPADPSHSEIEGLPPADSPIIELIGDMIAECVTTVHPARP